MLWMLLFFSICVRAPTQSSNHNSSNTHFDAAGCIEGTGSGDWREAQHVCQLPWMVGFCAGKCFERVTLAQWACTLTPA